MKPPDSAAGREGLSRTEAEMAKDVEMVAGITHSAWYGFVRKGEAFTVPADKVEQIQPRLAKVTGAPTDRSADVDSAADRKAGPETGALPDEYPSREILVAAGFDTRDKVEVATDDDLLDLDGIGPATLQKIRGFKD